MSTPKIITKEYFIKRFCDLVVKSGLTDFPKDESDQHILLKSIILNLGKAETFSEKEINEKIQFWTLAVARTQKMDHSTLRRYLVDSGYLTRSTDGSRYQAAPGSRADQFDPEVDQIDLLKALETAREEIEQRKRAYLEKANVQKPKP